MKSISTIILSLMVVISSMTISFSAHYCGEILKDFAFFTEAEDCPMEQKMHLDCRFNAQATEDNCCDQQEGQIDGVNLETTLAEKHIDFDQAQLSFILAYVATYAHSYASEVIIAADYKTIHSPLIEKDIPVFIQSFLI